MKLTLFAFGNLLLARHWTWFRFRFHLELLLRLILPIRSHIYEFNFEFHVFLEYFIDHSRISRLIWINPLVDSIQLVRSFCCQNEWSLVMFKSIVHISVDERSVHLWRWFTEWIHTKRAFNIHFWHIQCAPCRHELNRVHLLVSFFFVFYFFHSQNVQPKFNDITAHSAHCSLTSVQKIELIVISLLNFWLPFRNRWHNIIHIQTSVLLSIVERQRLLGSALSNCVSFRCTNKFRNPKNGKYLLEPVPL